MKSAEAAVTYSRSPTVESFSGDITISVSGSDFQTDLGDGDPAINYWGVMAISLKGNTVVSPCASISVLAGSFTFSLPVGSYTEVDVSLGATESDCEDVNLGSFAQGAVLEGNGTYVIFTVTRREGGTTPVNTPEVKILSSVPEGIFSGPLEIEYIASDKDDEIGRPHHGLKENPVNVYWNSSDEESSRWHLIAGDQPASDTIVWDTSKIRDGEYRLRVTASGADQDFGQIITDPFVVDSSPPHFDVAVVPSFSRGERVEISIESSESLKNQPTLEVSQAGEKLLPVELKGRADFRKFVGYYKVFQGYDGLAKLSISGEDLAGNKGSAITGDDSFWVGIEPPPAPVIKSPENKTTITENKIDIEGIAINAKKVIVKVNSEKEYVEEKIGRRGQFLVKNIELDPLFNKGRNFVSIVSEDFKGIISEPATLEVMVNSPPTVTIIEPRGRGSKLNGKIRFAWKSFDVNDDILNYEVNISDDGGNSWKILAKDLRVKEFIWDSSQTPDSSNYLVRVMASDGFLKNEAVGRRFSIVNNLPAIILDASGDFFTSEDIKHFEGFVRSKEDLLQKLELSFDSGKGWEEVLPEDGVWDTNLEKFSIEVKNIKTGSKSIILRGTSKSGQAIINAQNLKIFFDNKIPTFVSEDLSEKPSNKQFLKINGVARDDFAGIKSVEYAIDDSLWFGALIERGIETGRAEFKINHPERLKDGEHEIKIRAIDRAGNVSKLKTQKIFLDSTPPKLGSFILETDEQGMLFPRVKNIFEVERLPLNINLRLAIAGEPAKVQLFINNEEASISLGPVSKLWESSIKIIEENAILKIETQDYLGNTTERDIAKIVLDGRGTEKLSRSFWQKILGFFNIK